MPQEASQDASIYGANLRAFVENSDFEKRQNCPKSLRDKE